MAITLVQKYNIEGRVADKKTQEPIEGIVISITTQLPTSEDPNITEPKEFITKSDTQGNFILPIEINTEETIPGVYSVLETPDLIFKSEDFTYGQEKRKPYVGDNDTKTVKTSLDVIQMKRFAPDLNKEISKLQNVGAEEIENLKSQLPKDPFQSLQKSVSGKIQDILKKFIPLIIGMIAQFGISKLTEALQNNFSDFNSTSCPSPEDLKKIIRKRNKVVRILNFIYKFVDALVKVTGIVLTLVQIFKLVKNVVVNLPIPQAIGTPPAKDFGGLISAQPMSATLKSADTISQFEVFIKKYEGLTIMVLSILTVLRAVLKMAIDLLKGLDGLISICAQEYLDQEEVTLEEINAELLASLEEGEEEVQLDPFINGFEISVIEIEKEIGSLKRRQAIARNKSGIILLKGEPSFSASDQILIDELKFYITQNNLKAN
jgi:hypothetical protein